MELFSVARRLFLTNAAFILLLAVGCDTTPATPDAAPSETAVDSAKLPMRERWEAFFMQDDKVGYNHVSAKIERRNGDELVRYQADTEIRLMRFNAPTTQSLSYSSVETPAGRLVEFKSSIKSAGQATTVQGAVDGDVLRIETQSAGSSFKSTIPWDSAWLGCFGEQLTLRRKPMQPGESRTFRMLMPIFNQVVEVTMTAKEKESTFVLTEQRELLRIDSVIKMETGELRTTYWCDAEGEIHKAVTHASGVNQSAYLSTKEFCLAPGPSPKFDLGLDAAVKVARALDQPHATKQIVYQVTVQHDSPLELFAQGESQTVRLVSDHVADIIVRSVRPPFVTVGKAEPEPADLEPNSIIQSNDARVIRMANEIAAGETDPWKVAVALEKGVHQAIRTKGFSQALATAAEVAKNLEGDCTEHAVLLAALCRARKIPARVAMGLIYFPNEQAFAYHMWTEAAIQNHWVPLDATLGQGGIGAAHLKIADANLAGAGPFAAILPVVRVLGQLEMEIKEVQ